MVEFYGDEEEGEEGCFGEAMVGALLCCWGGEREGVGKQGEEVFCCREDIDLVSEVSEVEVEVGGGELTGEGQVFDIPVKDRRVVKVRELHVEMSVVESREFRERLVES